MGRIDYKPYAYCKLSKSMADDNYRQKICTNSKECPDYKEYITKEEENILLREQVKVLREALRAYSECCDGCTCGDGWDHDIAIEALSQTKPKDGE